jgi:general secretion pathway protein A
MGNTDYLAFFGLNEDPFRLSPDPSYFFPSPCHNDGLTLLDYSIEQNEGFTILTGEPGTGKTTLLNVFLDKWRPKAEIAIILTPKLTPEEFLSAVVEDFGLKTGSMSKNEIIKTFRDFMMEKSSEGKRTILIVDEAQNLPDDTLEELRLLSNLETGKNKLFQIVLVGQTELETRLMKDRLRQLNQRIITRVRLRRLGIEETLDYINHRLIRGGKGISVVRKKTAALVCRLSGGVPRLINMLSSRALMAAYLEESLEIKKKHIMHALKSLDHSELAIQRPFRPAFITAVILLSILVLGTGRYFYLKNDNAANDPTSLHMTGAINSSAIKTPVVGYLLVRTGAANIREEPSTSAKKTGWVLRGDRFEVLGEARADNNIKWYQILHGGRKRWISEEVAGLTPGP